MVDGFIEGYRAGRTPNPCVRCNGELRIDAMIELADRLGAEHLVTGHYARLVDDGEGPLLAASRDSGKDQTHMLASLRPASLRRLRFPLAELTKSEVREIAAHAELAVARQPESQDLCFLSGTGKREFLRRHGGLEDEPGEIVDESGLVLGEHRGHQHFTVGQRRGLGVADAEPLYVLSKDAESNRVVVGRRERLAKRVGPSPRRLACTASRAGSTGSASATTRRPLACQLEATGNGGGELVACLAEPAYGVAPGQTASLLDGDLVVGHGTIV